MGSYIVERPKALAGDVDQRAADISVNQPRVVEGYRVARDVAMRERRDQTSASDFRKAMDGLLP